MAIQVRIITIINETHLTTEHFKLSHTNNYNGYNIDYDFGGDQTLEIISTFPYKWLKVTQIEADYDIKKEKIIIKKCKKCIERKNLNSNIPIYIIASVGEILPEYKVEFKRYDGIEGSFFISESQKSGEFVALDYKLKHTLGSVLFYLFR